MEYYGVGYLGSKNLIAGRLIDAMPSATLFVDLFGGGGAMTHAALLSGKYTDGVVCSDLDGDGLEVFRKAMFDEYAERPNGWVSREEFQAKKGCDPYIGFFWSFGNMREDYQFGRHIAPLQYAKHRWLHENDDSLLRVIGLNPPAVPNEAWLRINAADVKAKYLQWLKRTFGEAPEGARGEIAEAGEQIRNILRAALKESGMTLTEVARVLGHNMARHYFVKSQWAKPSYAVWSKLRAVMPSLPPYEELPALHDDKRAKFLQAAEKVSLKSVAYDVLRQRADRMRSVSRLAGMSDRVKFLRAPYDSVKVEDPKALIYCDPPYRGTEKYDFARQGGGFDHEAFYSWCERQEQLVIVSEYDMPEERFTRVMTLNKQNSLGKNNVISEGLFVVKGREGEYRRRMAETRGEASLFDWAETAARGNGKAGNAAFTAENAPNQKREATRA